MELGKYIESALRSLLRDPIVSLLRQIGFASILKQSNFTKRSVGISPYPVVLYKAALPLSNKVVMLLAKISVMAF